MCQLIHVKIKQLQWLTALSIALLLNTAHADEQDLIANNASLNKHTQQAVPSVTPQQAKQSIFFLGVSQHFKSQEKTRNGNMALLGYARNNKHKQWNFENGAATFLDSYNQRSYMVFSNITNDRLNSPNIQPTLGLNCAYKGYSYKHNGKRLLCSPPIKIRLGQQKGLFAYITPVPKIDGLTNGLVSLEVGYKF